VKRAMIHLHTLSNTHWCHYCMARHPLFIHLLLLTFNYTHTDTPVHCSTSFDILHGLTLVPRFSVTRMMLLPGEKRAIAEALTHIAAAHEKVGVAREEIVRVALLYSVKL
jgi:hypothetical protein